MLSANNLVKKFGATTAVGGVTFTVPQGAVFGLLGPNGAGKTTTIRMLLDIITPDEGRVLFDGMPLDNGTKNRVGYLPEERGLYRKGIVLETILYFMALKNMEHAAARSAALQWLERFQLANRAKSKIEELSKGNQQKVQFILSVMHNPDVLVLDEPFAGFDPLNQDLLTEIILEQKTKGKAIVFSTHQMEQAEKLCDSICLMNRGAIVLDGTLADIKRRYSKNSLLVEFSGDGSPLADAPGIDRAAVYANSAELRLRNGAQVNDIIRYLIDKVALRKIELVEPSLHSIFIETVGEPEGAKAIQ